MASEALQKQSAFGELDRVLNKGVSQLAAALPRMGQASAEMHLARAQRAVRCALTLLRSNPKLLDCTQASVLGSVIQACQLGLELDGVLGQSYLVPYAKTAQLQVGYRGMIALAIRSGTVSSIAAEVVYDGDVFDFQYGTSPLLMHRPGLGKAGNAVAAYAVATMIDGTHTFKVMTLEQIDVIMNSSKGKGSGPWKDHWEEMARKTAVRNLCKYLPQSPDAQRAAVHDEYVESGHAPPQPKLEDFTIEAESEEVPS